VDLPSLRIPEASAGGGAAGAQKDSGARGCPHQEADELFLACPFASDAQRVEFLAVTTPPFEMPKGKRPTAEQLAVRILVVFPEIWMRKCGIPPCFLHFKWEFHEIKLNLTGALGP
jgi:hypothetical protein